MCMLDTCVDKAWQAAYTARPSAPSSHHAMVGQTEWNSAVVQRRPLPDRIHDATGKHRAWWWHAAAAMQLCHCWCQAQRVSPSYTTESTKHMPALHTLLEMLCVG